MSDAYVGLLGAIVGAIIGGVFSYIGSVRATKTSITEQKYLSERTQSENVRKAAGRLIAKVIMISDLAQKLVNTSRNLPQEIAGLLPVIEHRLVLFGWSDDLAIASDGLKTEEYNAILKFMTGAQRCDDIISRIWELRASGQDFTLQLHSFWNMLPTLSDSQDILRSLKAIEEKQ